MVIDLRDRADFAADHLAGTAGIELGSQFATYVGWLVPWGAPLTLLGQDRDQVRAAQLQLARIGIGRPAGATVGDLDVIGAGLPRTGYKRVCFASVPEPAAGQVILDVRAADEYARGHLHGARHLPIGELPAAWPRSPAAASGCTARPATAPGSGQPAGPGRARDFVLVDDDLSRALLAALPARAALPPPPAPAAQPA